MIFLKKIKKLFCDTCVIFSLVVFITLALWAGIAADKVVSTGMLFGRAFSALAFAFIIACLNGILWVRRLRLPLRLLIHFAGSMLSFYIFFLKAGSYTEKSSGALIILLLVALLYIITALTAILIRHFNTRKKNDDSSYEKQFDFEK